MWPSFLLHSLRTPHVFTMWGRRDDAAKFCFAFVAYTSRVYDVRSPQRWCLLLHSLRTLRVFTMWGRRSDDAAKLSFAFVPYTSRIYDVRSPQRWCGPAFFCIRCVHLACLRREAWDSCCERYSTKKTILCLCLSVYIHVFIYSYLYMLCCRVAPLMGICRYPLVLEVLLIYIDLCLVDLCRLM